MFKRLAPQFKFSRQHRRELQNLVIDHNGPGTILRDFEAVLAFFKNRNLPLTGRHQLTLRVLPEINALLARPLQLGLQRPQQKSYPHIHGLYLLVRASGLTFVGETPKKPLLIVDDAAYQAWTGLSYTERYGSLLETWLLRGLPEIVGEDRRAWSSIPETFDKWRNFFARVPDEGLRVAGDDEVESELRYWPGWHNLGLLELFGLVTVRRGPPRPGKGWRIAHIQRTPLGDALLAALYEGFFGDPAKVFELDTAGRTPFDVLQPIMQPHLPAWQKTLIIPEWTFRDGLYFFRASLGATWRRIAIPASASLDALAAIILDAFEFNHDHLYRFSYQNRFGIIKQINHIRLDDDGPWTRDVQIGDVPLGLGQTMVYLFDFGDFWEFDVTLERVDLPDKKVNAPTILDGRGAAPQQYPVWDDEDW